MSSPSPTPQAPQIQSPTSFLPPLGKLSSTTTSQIYEALRSLRGLYFPHTQPSTALTTSCMSPSLVLAAPGSNPVAAGLGIKDEAAKMRSRGNTLTLANCGALSPASTTGYNTPVIDSGYASAYVSDDEDEDEEQAAVPAFKTTAPDSHQEAESSCCALLCRSSEKLERECKSLEVLRADTFERTFVLRWLTGFVSRAEMWVEEGALLDEAEEEASEGEVKVKETDDEEEEEESAGGREYTLRAALLEEALDVLAAFTSADQANDDDDEEEDPSYLRTLSFPCPFPGASSVEDGSDTLTMHINDARINEDDHTSVGLQTWGSSIIFAERLCAQPLLYIHFSPPPSSPSAPQETKRPFRILELGAGTGILSIVVEKLFQRGDLGSEAMEREIVATDFHPEVLDNLRKNVEINFPSSPSSLAYSPNSLSPLPTPIDVQTLDWQHPPSHTPLNEPFDLILAADVVYHPEHARWIKECVEKLLKPDGGVFWMFIALRASGRHEGLDASVDEIFGEPVGNNSAALGEGVKEENHEGERKLRILETERLGRKSSRVGRADECAYRLFKIGWVR